MTRADTADSVSPRLKKFILYTAVSGTFLGLSAIIAVLSFVTFLNPFRVIALDAIPTSHFSFTFNVFCFFLSTGLATLSLSKTTETRIKASWMHLYKDTKWQTPGGEIGAVVGVSLSGDTLELVFEDGDKRTYAFQHLSPKGEEDHADMSGLQEDGMPDYYDVSGMASFYGGLFVTCLIIWAVPTIALWNTMSFTVAVTLGSLLYGGASFTLAIILTSRELVRPSKISDQTFNMAQSPWKSLDGKVGVVRWADRVYKGDGLYQENIVLSFPEVGLRSFRREDLLPIAFERNVA